MFIHPGREQVVPSGENGRKWVSCPNDPGWYRCGWTRDGHGRKFVEAAGEYVTADGKIHKAGALRVWCEAEWNTKYHPLINSPEATRFNIFPKRLHKLYPSIRDLTSGGKNTDPYIFGKQFIYSNCRQNKLPEGGLASGDIILFGSIKEEYDNHPRSFLLDTVFVVGAEKFHITSQTLFSDIRATCGNRISQFFGKTVWEPLKYGDRCAAPLRNCVPDEYTLYFGASFHEKYQGMFSFSPIRIPGLSKIGNDEHGYPRLTMTKMNVPKLLRDVINFDINPRFGVSCKADCDNVGIWNELKKFVFEEGYACGTRFAEP